MEQLLKHFVPEVVGCEKVTDEQAAALIGSAVTGKGGDGKAAAAESFGPEKVSIEEHIRRMVAEGAATSIVWEDTRRQL